MIRSQSLESIPFGKPIELEGDFDLEDNLNVFHFYDPDCAIGKNNLEHLKLLSGKYQGRRAQWFVVLNREVDQLEAQRRLGFEVSFIEDKTGILANSLGVVTTPKMVIVADGILYFRGSYLKNGAFCGPDDIVYSDAGVALRSGVKGLQLPIYLKDIESYVGCSL